MKLSELLNTLAECDVYDHAKIHVRECAKMAQELEEKAENTILDDLAVYGSGFFHVSSEGKVVRICPIDVKGYKIVEDGNTIKLGKV